MNLFHYMNVVTDHIEIVLAPNHKQFVRLFCVLLNACYHAKYVYKTRMILSFLKTYVILLTSHVKAGLIYLLVSRMLVQNGTVYVFGYFDKNT